MMYSGRAEESVECPVCGAKLWEVRPPLRLGPNRFKCEKCETLLRFSVHSQKRLIYVFIAVCVFGLVAFLANHIFGDIAGTITATCGAIIALGILVWQSKVPQVEIDK